MDHPILSETDLTSINFWISNLEHQKIKDNESKLKVVNQAENTLNFSYKLIGSGRSRIVFDLENGFVLKIAISYVGIIANEREYNHYSHCPDDLRRYLCPVEAFGHSWIIMKKMESTHPNDEKYNKKLLKMEKKFIKYGISPDDIRNENGHPKLKNLAVSEEGVIIIIDYGSFKHGKPNKSRRKRRIRRRTLVQRIRNV
jgi:hypothetical protein